MCRRINRGFIFSLIAILCVLMVSCTFNRHYYNEPALEYLGFPEANNLVWPANEPDTILFSTTDESNHSAIITVDLSSGQTQTVMEAANGIIEIETVSPDGNQIIFHAEEGTEGFERGGLWIMQMDTGQVEYFRNGDHAAWSPDGISVLVTKIESSSNDEAETRVILSLVNMEDGDENIHTFDNMDDANRPSWAPDGYQVALPLSYAHSRVINIFKIDTRTWEFIHLTNGDVELSPSWSPVGDVIAYKSSHLEFLVQTDDNFPELFLINADGSCDMGMGGLDSIQSPQWSPDGQNMVFIGPDGVYLFNIGVIIFDHKLPGCSS